MPPLRMGSVTPIQPAPSPTPGLLFVTFQPEPSFPHAQFHDWYNNEHGPARLRLSCFKNGFRYRVRGDAKPGWMVIYHVSDVTGLVTPPYTTLREPGVKTERETEVMRHVEIKRAILNHIYTKQARDIPVRESGAVVISERFEVPIEQDHDFNRWYEEEHIPLLSQVPGWLRSRRYSTYSKDGAHPAEYVALHEYDVENGLEGPELQSALNTDWFHKVMNYTTKKSTPVIWDILYTFGPAPRDLNVLLDPSTYFFQSRDGRTVTWPIPGADSSSTSDSYQVSRYGGSSWPYQTPSWPALRSFVTTHDGLDLPYQLEGSGDPNAPLIVLINPIIVSYQVWDAFVVSFLSTPSNKHFRVLRYNVRGYSSETGSLPLTMDLLASDLIAILDALNVPRAALAVGVGLGGATAQNASIQHPDRVPAFIACDINHVSTLDGARTWGKCIEIADKENAKSASGEAIVGKQLAQEVVERWLPNELSSNSNMSEEVTKLKEMIRVYSRDGFKKVASALEHNLQPDPIGANVKALFVNGGGGRVNPKREADIAQNYGESAKVEIIDGAGHMPMVEATLRMTEIVGKFAT